MSQRFHQEQTFAKRLGVLSFILTAHLLSFSGCGSSSAIRLEDYLEEIEFEVPLISSAVVPLGNYSIPIPARSHQDSRGDKQVTWVQLKFQLYAVVSPENQSAVQDAWEHDQGLYYDGALTICRTASLDDVVDPNLAAIKSRLTDLSQAVFGKKRIRQLLYTNISTELI